MARTPEINEDHIRKAVKYRPRRSYIVRDTMFLKGVSENTVNVPLLHKAIIGILHLQDAKVTSATIYDGWQGYSQTTNRHLRSLHNFVNGNNIPARIVQDRLWS